MSYTKTTFNDLMWSPLEPIRKKTLEDNDFTDILSYINASLIIKETITQKDNAIGQLWNEIISDTLASITLASSGYYRSAIIILRSVLELGCSSFFYYDHHIEYKMFQREDMKADTYVSTLIRDYHFFTTKYIKTFYEDIENQQTSPNSVSDFLKNLYAELSDALHGRYKALSKLDGLKIKYEKAGFSKYQKYLFSVLSILAIMYVLRFQDKTDTEILALANKSKVVSI